jgi:hypothetical protein
LEPVISDVSKWFTEMDHFRGEPFLEKGRRQPRPPRRILFR